VFGVSLVTMMAAERLAGTFPLFRKRLCRGSVPRLR
jgi:hypothetical protein